MSSANQVDVVVIGSGAGGAPVATVLAESGARVVVLEKGPYYTSQDFVHDEVKICRRNFWVPYTNEEPHALRKTVAESAHISGEAWTSNCVGGATVHMSGFFYRLQPCDFNLATRTAGIENSSIADWPITLKELLPYYDLMESRIGVSGRAGRNPFEVRSRPYPLPPLRPHPAAQLFDVAARGLGYHPFPTPRAIVSKSYGRRPPCNLCGLCGDYGCENTSKSSTLVTFIPDAEATGRCQIISQAMARRILVDDSDAVKGVEYIDQHGKPHVLQCKVVCLAASAVESARLLLLSETNRFPDGLANRQGLVGQNLTFSTLGKASALFDRAAIEAAIGKAGMNLPFLQRSVQDDYWREDWASSLPKGGTYNFILRHPNPINSALNLVKESNWTLFGESLKKRLKEHFQDELKLEFEIFGESLPWSGSFLDLDPKIKDRFGLPVARITSSNHPLSNQVNKLMMSRGMEIMSAMKPAPKRVRAWTWENTSYHLQQGTCRFGRDPDTSVLDTTCQSHEVKNLYVTDGSFMPTSGGAPSTPTIMANSLRVGNIIRDRFLRREI